MGKKLAQLTLVLSVMAFSACNKFNVGDYSKLNDNNEARRTCKKEQGCVTLNWNPSTQMADGTPVAVAGYKIYYGISTQTYDQMIDVGNVVEAKVDKLSPGTYYFAVTAYLINNGNVIESTFSNEASTSTAWPTDPFFIVIVP